MPEYRLLAIDDDDGILKNYQQILDPEKLAELDELESMWEDEDDGDEANNTKALDDLFEFRLDTVNQGALGVEQVKKALDEGHPYSVIFIDMRMPPGIDGLATAQQIKALDRHVHIVIVTAYSDYSVDEIHMALRNNVLFVRKPFDSGEVAQLARVLSLSWRTCAHFKKLKEQLENELLEKTEAFDTLTEMLKDEMEEHEDTKQTLLTLQQSVEKSSS